MLLLALSIFLLAIVLVVITNQIVMKTSELSKAVSDNTTATNGLAASVDAAVAVLVNAGQPSTPDADIVPLIDAINNNTTALANAKAKLDAAVNPATA